MRKHLRFVMLSVMMMLTGYAMAESVITFTAGVELGNNTSANGADQVSKQGVTISVTSGGFAAPQYRFAKSSTATFTSTVGNITKVEFTCTASDDAQYGPGCFSDATPGAYAFEGNTGVWTGNAASFQLTASKAQVRATTIAVTIDGEAGPDTPTDKPDPVVQSVSVEQALAVIDGLADGATTADVYRVKGFVISVTEISTQYGNATFVLADGRDARQGLTVFRAKGFEGQSITNANLLKVGDEVEVEGKLQRYVKGDEMTPEMATGGTIISINGKTGDEGGQPVAEVREISVEQALDIINEELADGATTAEEYLVTGFVVGTPDFQRNNSGQLYGNVNFGMADEKGGAPVLTVFRAKDFDNAVFTEETISRLKEGDEVAVRGKLQRYVRDGEMTPELSSGYLVSVNSGAGIGRVLRDAASATVYNLHGQRVGTMRKGLYIVNGKKVLK